MTICLSFLSTVAKGIFYTYKLFDTVPICDQSYSPQSCDTYNTGKRKNWPPTSECEDGQLLYWARTPTKRAWTLSFHRYNQSDLIEYFVVWRHLQLFWLPRHDYSNICSIFMLLFWDFCFELLKQVAIFHLFLKKEPHKRIWTHIFECVLLFKMSLFQKASRSLYQNIVRDRIRLVPPWFVNPRNPHRSIVPVMFSCGQHWLIKD